MSNYETFNKVFLKWHTLVARAMATNFLDPNYKPWWLTWVLFSLICAYLVFSAYTIVTHDFEASMKCLTCNGIAIQGVAKALCFFVNYPELYQLFTFLRDIYKLNIGNTTNEYVLTTTINWTSIIYRTLFFIYVCSGICMLGLPFLSLFVEGEISPLLPTFIPFTDEKTYVGFLQNSVYHVTCVIMAVNGTCLIDLYLVSLVLNTYGLIGIIENTLTPLNEAIVSKKMQTKPILRNLILMHKELCWYLEKIDELFFYSIFCQVYTTTFAMCLLSFVLLQMSWFQAYFVFVMSFFQLFSYCIVGTLIEIQNDRLYAITNDCQWYDLPVSEQKLFMFMIIKTQHPIFLTVGGVTPLNVETFLDCLQKVYSIAMMLYRTTH